MSWGDIAKEFGGEVRHWDIKISSTGVRGMAEEILRLRETAGKDLHHVRLNELKELRQKNEHYKKTLAQIVNLLSDCEL